MAESTPGLPGIEFLAFVERADERTRTEVKDLPSGPGMAINLLLRRVDRRLASGPEGQLLPDGITWSAFRVCFTLWVTGPLEPHRIAVMASMSRAAVSAAWKALEAQGLVTSADSASDQRSILLALTDEGARLTRDIHRRSVTGVNEWLSALSIHEQHILVGLLGKLVAAEK